MAGESLSCSECGHTVQTDHRFCGRCGTSLSGVTDATEVLDTVTDDPPVLEPASAPAPPTTTASNSTPVPDTTPVDDLPGDPEWDADDPVWAITGAVPTTGRPAGDALRTTDLAVTQRSIEAIPGPVATDDPWSATTPAADATTVIATPNLPAAPTTTEMPAVVRRPASPAESRRQRRFHLTAATLFALLGGAIALVASFATAVKVTSSVRLSPPADAPGTFRTGAWILDDLADNMSIAVLVAALAMIIGGLFAGFGSRLGSGFAGGAALGMAGLMALAVGLAEVPLDTARDFAAVPNPQEFVLTLTRDIGFWLFVVAGALGVVTFFATLSDAIGERRRGLNPWIAAFGAAATVVAVVGPMLPTDAQFSDNWFLLPGTGNPGALLVAGRLAQLAALAITGVVGYLTVRRWGLGLAIGGALPIVWLAVSTLFELTSRPVGPAYRNPGAANSELHGMTIVGVSAVVAIGLLAAIAAYDQTSRERR